MHAIASEALAKTYLSGTLHRQQVQALDNVTLFVQTGEIFGLLGPNGAGKTTFIKTLLSITHPTSGQATVLGERLPNTRVKSRIGYLPENHRFPGHMSANEVLKLFGGLSGVPQQTLALRIPKLLELVGLARWRWTAVKKFSKGMMQRLGLAQALINDPELLFLDEPTDGVDPVGRKEIRDMLKELKRQGKTIFLNSHLLSEVEMVSDRVAVLNQGRLLKTGTIDELTTQGSSYQIGIEGELPDAFRHETAALLLQWSPVSEGLSADLKTLDELNSMIDLLRKHGLRITSVSRQRSTLEDSFLSLIKREIAP